MTLNELFARTDRYNFAIDLTPEIASEWISHSNSHNRKIIDSHVEQLAGEMRAGRWMLTHQGIAFSTNRVLLDGQHRLWAVVMSGVTVPMRIFVNEPPQAMDALDTGYRRTNDQIITLTGGMGQVTRNELATLRAMIAGLGPHQKRTAAVERELLARHRQAVAFAAEVMTGGRKFRGVSTAATKAVLARAWYSCDRDQLRRFGDVLRSGAPKGDCDQPIILLFQFLISTRGGRRPQPYEREVYAKTERALAAFIKTERLNRLHATASELFPLPEEAKAVA